MQLEESLGYLLNMSAKAIKRKFDAALKEYDITTSQWAVLKLLSVEEGLSQAEIAHKTNSDRATCGAIIDKLVSKELVEKTLSKSDRRSYIIAIVPNALKMVRAISSLAEEINACALKGFSHDEAEQFKAWLTAVTRNLTAEGIND